MPRSGFIAPSLLAPNEKERGKQHPLVAHKRRDPRHTFKPGDKVIWRYKGCKSAEFRATILALAGRSKLVLSWQGNLITDGPAFRETVPAVHCRIDDGKAIRIANSAAVRDDRGEKDKQQATDARATVQGMTATALASALSPEQRDALLKELTA